MKRIDKVLLASFAPLTIFSTSTLLTSCSQEIHYNVFFKTKAMATDIYVVDASTLPTDLVVTLESLQGILAQEKAQIYISHCDKNDPEGLRDE
ncbi:MAG: hypothetical protein MJ219_00305 [Mycoplasmoidaceae bacterium]|nr:hypothetical protein [Mycoplasmoidaceae bacterium]